MKMKANKTAAFEFQPFSTKQKKLLTWWTPKSPYADYDMIVCDGSIRSGKTVAMITSFIQWSTFSFSNCDFILAGKSMGALKRNVLKPMFQILNALNISYHYNRSENYIEIGSNTYYCFGASTEASQDVLQGLTAAGAYADEAALMPESFITQMIGRCSVDDSKVWMNCNPAGPYHFLKVDYIDKSEEKKILRLHFTIDDNNSLSKKVKERYKRMFSGVFFKRYILGLWVMAEGIIYDAFSDEMVVDVLPRMTRTWVGVDYGTSNATTFILIGLGSDERMYVIKEYYHSGRESGKQKSPSDYSRDFRRWWDERLFAADMSRYKPEYIYIDPSAQAFIVQLWQDDRTLPIAAANNDVKDGIELVSSIMSSDKFRVHRSCKNVLRELSSYSWDEKASQRGEDKPIKAHDHTLDPIRYVANGTIRIWQRLIKDLPRKEAA
jgi:PBSX family phage terminase large subunit